MVSSRAGFALAVVGVLGLFYVGMAQEIGVQVQPLFPQPKAAQSANSLDWERLGHTVGGKETIASSAPRTYRTKVPGGWLVEISRRSDGGTGVGLAFVPDATHKWDGNSLP